MLVDIKDKIKKQEFPIEVFGKDIQDNFLEISRHDSLPIGYMGTAALCTISGLSGNMYTTELNGNIKNIIYAAAIGPSGLGKTPAFNRVCGDIIADLSKEQKLQDDKRLKDWQEAQEYAKLNKVVFKEPKPHRIIRVIQGGTQEGILKNAEYSKCGFLTVWDEGGRMFGSPNQYKKDNSSTDFWNERWNGKFYEDLRADETRDRFIYDTAISAYAGLQTDRVGEFFTKDTIESGLPSRFIMTCSDYLELNETIDHFSEKGKICSEWRLLIHYLFKKGVEYSLFKDSKPTIISFTDEAKAAYNSLCQKLIRESNLNRANRKEGDVSTLMISYDSKLYQYVGRFLIPLSIIDNPKQPVIDVHHVENSEKLYRYYRREAEKVFTKIFYEHTTDLNENERALLEALPEQFTRDEAIKLSVKLKLSNSFFDVAFARKYNKKWINKITRGQYEKV